MLIDKGYYDYDYKVINKPIIAEDTVMDDDKMQKVLSRFGIGCKKKAPKDMDMEELQEYVIKNK